MAQPTATASPPRAPRRSSRPERIEASRLIRDYNLYPRHHIDEANVSALREAVASGVKLPPVCADRTTLKVSDGFHRIEQALRSDETAIIDVEFVDYTNEAELFLDAVRRNAQHGARLTTFDHARVISIAEDWNISPEQISNALSIPLSRITNIRTTRTAHASDGSKVQLKRIARSMAGQTLTPVQVEANKKAQGFPVAFYAEQIINAFDGDFVDLTEEHTVSALQRLHACLEEKLTTSPRKKVVSKH